MEVRLQETMSEAKRHYQSYMDIREQYNRFVEGRLNIMIKHLQESGTNNNMRSGSNKATMGGLKA